MKKIKEFLKMNAWVMILDIIAVNVSYYLALLVRFYVNFEFRPSVGYYLDYFGRFAPIYTVICLIVFLLWRLYGGMWTYAGLNDMNRILGASLTTAVLQVIGTLLMGMRMPITYYTIGAFLQFLLVSTIRFSYRFLNLEKNKIAKSRESTIPALVIGSGSFGRKVIHHLENNTPYRAVIIVGKDSGRMMDGIPILKLEDAAEQIKARKITAVFIADKELTKPERDRINKIADGLEVQDYTGQLSNLSGFVPLSALMEIVEGPVTVVIDGQEKRFEGGMACLDSLDGEYDVQSVNASRITIRKAGKDDSWMKVYQEQTGEDVSFF